MLPRDLHRLGKALARGSGYKSIADAVIDSAALRKAVEDRLCSDVNIGNTSWKVLAYGIYARVVDVSEIERVSAANE